MWSSVSGPFASMRDRILANSFSRNSRYSRISPVAIARTILASVFRLCSPRFPLPPCGALGTCVRRGKPRGVADVPLAAMGSTGVKWELTKSGPSSLHSATKAFSCSFVSRRPEKRPCGERRCAGSLEFFPPGPSLAPRLWRPSDSPRASNILWRLQRRSQRAERGPRRPGKTESDTLTTAPGPVTWRCTFFRAPARRSSSSSESAVESDLRGDRLPGPPDGPRAGATHETQTPRTGTCGSVRRPLARRAGVCDIDKAQPAPTVNPADAAAQQGGRLLPMRRDARPQHIERLRRVEDVEGRVEAGEQPHGAVVQRWDGKLALPHGGRERHAQPRALGSRQDPEGREGGGRRGSGGDPSRLRLRPGLGLHGGPLPAPAGARSGWGGRKLVRHDPCDGMQGPRQPRCRRECEGCPSRPPRPAEVTGRGRQSPLPVCCVAGGSPISRDRRRARRPVFGKRVAVSGSAIHHVGAPQAGGPAGRARPGDEGLQRVAAAPQGCRVGCGRRHRAAAVHAHEGGERDARRLDPRAPRARPSAAERDGCVDGLHLRQASRRSRCQRVHALAVPR